MRTTCLAGNFGSCGSLSNRRTAARSAGVLDACRRRSGSVIEQDEERRRNRATFFRDRSGICVFLFHGNSNRIERQSRIECQSPRRDTHAYTHTQKRTHAVLATHHERLRRNLWGLLSGTGLRKSYRVNVGKRLGGTLRRLDNHLALR